MIKKLPQHLINKLKAWEIVERPVSIVKELVENSLDAGATQIAMEISAGGKKLIKIQDNGSGMTQEDLQLSIERYATSKLDETSDIELIESYGFRGEALASVSEVSVFRIQTRQADAPESWIWYELYRSEWRYEIKQIPFAREQGTTVFVEDVFHHIPAREKFLKTDSTERNYIKKMFLQYALVHRDKKWSLIKDGKPVYDFLPAESLMERILAVTKKDRENKLKPLAYKDKQLELYGVAGDASLHFATGQYFWLFVNGRPVQDRVLKSAVMEAYKRQIVPGSHPFVCLFVEIDPRQVDVNVHPRKLEVKFLDPGSVHTRVKETIRGAIGNQKVNYAAFNQKAVREWSSSSDWERFNASQYRQYQASLSESQIQWIKNVGDMRNGSPQTMFHPSDLDKVHLEQSQLWTELTLISDQESYTLIGQLRQSYILLQAPDALVYIDQHALAERIAFEQMKKKIAADGFHSEVLLQPLSLEIPKDIDIESKIELLSSIGFDASTLSEQKLVIYAIPRVFHERKVDIELIINRVRWAENTTTGPELFSLMVDEMVWMKACKASIKAGQKLSHEEMKQLVQDWFTYIPGMFVCQHGRPSAVRIQKGNVDGLFERH